MLFEKESPKVAHFNDAELVDPDGVCTEIALSFVLNNSVDYKRMDDPDDVDDPFPYQG